MILASLCGFIASQTLIGSVLAVAGVCIDRLCFPQTTTSVFRAFEHTFRPRLHYWYIFSYVACSSNNISHYPQKYCSLLATFDASPIRCQSFCNNERNRKQKLSFRNIFDRLKHLYTAQRHAHCWMSQAIYAEYWHQKAQALRAAKVCCCCFSHQTHKNPMRMPTATPSVASARLYSVSTENASCQMSP